MTTPKTYPQPAEPDWATGDDWPEARAAQALAYAHARLHADYDPAMTDLERELCRAVEWFARRSGVEMPPLPPGVTP